MARWVCRYHLSVMQHNGSVGLQIPLIRNAAQWLGGSADTTYRLCSTMAWRVGLQIQLIRNAAQCCYNSAKCREMVSKVVENFKSIWYVIYTWLPAFLYQMEVVQYWYRASILGMPSPAWKVSPTCPSLLISRPWSTYRCQLYAPLIHTYPHTHYDNTLNRGGGPS